MLYPHASNSQYSIINLVTRIRVGRSGVWIPVVWCERSSRFQKVQTGCKAHPDFQWAARALFPGVRSVGAWGWPLAYIYSRGEICVCVCVCVYVYIYRVSQEEWTKLRESVPYVELYRYNPKHLYSKLNGYGDNGKRSLKLWQLLHTYWLPNTY